MIYVACTSFNIGTGAAGTTVDVPISDPYYGAFTPVVSIYWHCGRASNIDAGGSQTSLFGMGWATSASNFVCWATRDVDGGGSSVVSRSLRDDACIVEPGDASNVGWADVQAYSSGNIRLEILDAFATNLRVHCLVLGGDVQAECGIFTAAGTAPVTQTVNNSANFPPDLTLFGGTIPANDPPVAVADTLRLLLGGFTSSSAQAVSLAITLDAAPSGDTASYGLDTECIAGGNTTAIADRAEAVSHNSSPGGFTINWLERANASRIAWLSMRSTVSHSRLALKTFTCRTDSADQPLTDFGFIPRAIMVASVNHTTMTHDATPVIHAEFTVGAATLPSNQLAQSYSSRDGNTNMFVQTAINFSHVLLNYNPTTDAQEALYKLVSLDGDGVTLSGADDPQPAADFAWLWAVGEIPDYPPLPRRYDRMGDAHGRRSLIVR